MGYRRPVKAYRLKFEQEDMAGLEVTARSLPLGEFLKVTELASLDKDDPAAAKSAGELFRLFASSLLEWNLEDGFGDPVPATYAGVLAQDLDFMMAIILAWVGAMSDVDGGLGKGSSSGGTSGLEQSIPMETRSASPPS
jgi:hypothetical protein